MLLTIADAVAAALNDEANNWSLEFTAVRVIDTAKTTEELQSLNVVVHPWETVRERSDRAGVQVEHAVSIGIRQRIAGTGNETLDPLINLTLEIAEFFDGYFVEGPGEAEALCSVAETPVLAEPSSLLRNLYLGVIRLSFMEL